MLKKLTTLTLAIAVLSSIASSAVIGRNEYLEANGGKAYIPQKESTSGVLGELNENSVIAGASSDRVRLSKTDISVGFLTYTLEFDLSTNYLEGGGEPQALTAENIDTDSPMELTLALTDIDFLPVTGSGRLYMETMSIVFRTDNYDYDGDPLLIDADNYLNYRSDGGIETDKTQAEYVINMFDLLGDDAINAMLANMKFYLDITLQSYTERTASGTAIYQSTKEYLGDYSAEGDGVAGSDIAGGNELTFAVTVPEPMTASLLVMGAIALIRRRKA